MLTLQLRVLPHGRKSELPLGGWLLEGLAADICADALEAPWVLALTDRGRLATDEEIAVVRAFLLDARDGACDERRFLTLALARLDSHVPPDPATHSIAELARLPARAARPVAKRRFVGAVGGELVLEGGGA